MLRARATPAAAYDAPIATRSERLRWFTSRLALCAVLWIAFVLARIVYFAHVDEAASADAIVVLGAAAYGDVPSHALAFHVVTSPTPTSVFRTWRTKLPFFLRELVYFHLYLIKGE